MERDILNIDLDLNLASLTLMIFHKTDLVLYKEIGKLFITLTESTNSILGNNLVYTHTLTDDQKHGLIQTLIISVLTNFDNTRSSEPIQLPETSLNSNSVDDV